MKETEAMYKLGVMCEYGEGAKNDKRKATIYVKFIINFF